MTARVCAFIYAHVCTHTSEHTQRIQHGSYILLIKIYKIYVQNVSHLLSARSD